jgi:cation diffusion facilitator family transporter
VTSHDRTEKSLAGAKTGIIVNFFLVLIKAAAGISAGSFAMLADALHSFADIVASAVVYVGIRVASKPADADHPYGHGKAESIASKIVAILVILAGLNIAYLSTRALFSVPQPAPGVMALWAAAISIVVKEMLFRYTIKISMESNSKVLMANAYEHRSDAISSVAAFIGIGGARLGLFFDQPQLYYLDPLAGMLVSVFIIRMGWQIAKDAANELMDSQADPSLTAALQAFVMQVEGVMEVHSIRARAAGPYIIVDLEIGVDEEITVKEGHDVAKRVKEKLLVENEQIGDIMIHVNPCRNCEEKKDLDPV